MNPSLGRVIRYVRDVPRLAVFYRQTFGLALVEEIPGEWAVLAAGACQIALHEAGASHVPEGEGAGTGSNVKLVLDVDGDLAAIRAELIAKGVAMRGIESYPPLTGPLCDGTDPEGNVFQLRSRRTGFLTISC